MTLADLPNLGPTSAQWLESVGIKTKADLEQVGPVEAYKRAEQAGYSVSLNLLWALVGALEGIDWREVPEEVKEDLRKQVMDEE